MDRITPERRSWNMSQVRSRDTKPEIAFRKAVWAKGYRYRICVKNLPGKPDLVFRRYKTAVFINGCFWHQHTGCKKAALPKTNQEFWKKKLQDNVERDKRNYLKLEVLGYHVMVIWECETKNINDCLQKFENFIKMTNI